MSPTQRDPAARKVLALIPARGGSKSISMKNLAPLAGKPLVAYSIATAQACRHIDRTVVSTDSEEIRRVSLGLGAEVPFLRPRELALDDTPDLPVFIHALKWMEENEDWVPEIVVHIRPTTPLRRAEHVDRAIKALLDDPAADSVRGVAPPVQNPFKMWVPGQPYMRPLIDSGIREAYNQPRQKLPQVYWQTGYIDVIRTSTLLEKNSMTGDRILPYVIDNDYVLDIDRPISLRLAEFFLAHGEY